MEAVSIDDLPGLRKAALEIAYDNGGINRIRTEEDALGEAEAIIRSSTADVAAIDEWLNALSSDDLNTVCAGEETAMLDLLATSPPGTDQLLKDIFDPPLKVTPSHWIELTHTADLACEFFNIHVREHVLAAHLTAIDPDLAAKFEAASDALNAVYRAIGTRASDEPEAGVL